MLTLSYLLSATFCVDYLLSRIDTSLLRFVNKTVIMRLYK